MQIGQNQAAGRASSGHLLRRDPGELRRDQRRAPRDEAATCAATSSDSARPGVPTQQIQRSRRPPRNPASGSARPGSRQQQPRFNRAAPSSPAARDLRTAPRNSAPQIQRDQRRLQRRRAPPIQPRVPQRPIQRPRQHSARSSGSTDSRQQLPRSSEAPAQHSTSSTCSSIQAALVQSKSPKCSPTSKVALHFQLYISTYKCNTEQLVHYNTKGIQQGSSNVQGQQQGDTKLCNSSTAKRGSNMQGAPFQHIPGQEKQISAINRGVMAHS